MICNECLEHPVVKEVERPDPVPACMRRGIEEFFVYVLASGGGFRDYEVSCLWHAGVVEVMESCDSAYTPAG
jgi:hypothetical protein